MQALCCSREEQSRLSLCQEGCQEQCPGLGAVLDLPEGASRWVSFGLCCGARSQGWITDIGVSWSATSKDLRMSEIPLSTKKGWFATVAWWKLGILGLPFWVQGVSLTPLLWWEMEPFLSIEPPAVDHGYSLAGTRQLSPACLQLALTAPWFNHTCGSEGKSSASC